MKLGIFFTILTSLVATCSCARASNNDVKISNTEIDSTATQQANKPDTATVTIAMTGDIMTGSKFPKPCLPANDGKDLFKDCTSILQSADVACGNLEGVLANSGRTRKSLTSKLAFSFMMPTQSVQLLVDAGFDFMGIANNHIYDFWDEGIESTINTLRDANVGVAGTKRCETCVREINGVKYGFCAFGHEDYSLKTQDVATVRRVITGLRDKCDLLIVCFHGGAEGTAYRHVPHGTEFFHGWNRGDVRQFAHLAVDCGADIVYGHGPHVPRGMELYNDHLIAYSLGNFATCGMGTAAQTGYAPLLVARINMKGKFIDGKIHSFIQVGRTGPRHDPSNKVAQEIKNLSLEDFPNNNLIIADDGTLSTK